MIYVFLSKSPIGNRSIPVEFPDRFQFSYLSVEFQPAGNNMFSHGNRFDLINYEADSECP